MLLTKTCQTQRVHLRSHSSISIKHPHHKHVRRQGTSSVTLQCSSAVGATETRIEKNETQIRSSCTRRIKDLGAAGKVKMAIQELASLAKLGVQPDTQAATALISACTVNRDMDLAEGVFTELFEEFLQPDEITFCVLMRGYGNAKPPEWRRISGLLSRMRNNFNLAPSLVTYNTLLDICLRLGDMERACDTLDDMRRLGLAPDEVTRDIVQRKRMVRSYARKVWAAGEDPA